MMKMRCAKKKNTFGALTQITVYMYVCMYVYSYTSTKNKRIHQTKKHSCECMYVWIYTIRCSACSAGACRCYVMKRNIGGKYHICVCMYVCIHLCVTIFDTVNMACSLNALSLSLPDDSDDAHAMNVVALLRCVHISQQYDDDDDKLMILHTQRECRNRPAHVSD